MTDKPLSPDDEELALLGPGFEDLGASDPVVDALAARGIDTAFAIQTLVLPDAMAGKDVLARSRTGSGKTLAFAVPIVERLKRGAKGPRALILVPTRELAVQVAEEFTSIAHAKALKVATAYGGVGLNDQAKRARAADILVATPGRLLDLENRKMVQLDLVKIAVLDEADRMLDMGFLPDVTKILKKLPEKKQMMLFSATLDGEVGRLAQRFTTDPVRHEVVDPRPVVTMADHRFVPVEPGAKIEALAETLAEKRGLALVFVRTKREADRLTHTMQTRGFKVEAMHGDMTQPARERALKRFEAGERDVLIATDVAARGLDLDDITHVINYDPPEDDKAYVHRVGRTARAGRTGVGVTFVLPDQRADVSRMAARLKLEVEFQQAGMKVHAPRMVYTGNRRGGGIMGRRPKRRF
jgi:superfamily II DNA/RNA helicase